MIEILKSCVKNVVLAVITVIVMVIVIAGPILTMFAGMISGDTRLLLVGMIWTAIEIVVYCKMKW